MWVLVVVAMAGGTASVTADTRPACESNFYSAALTNVKQAYCKSITGDMVYLVKNGRAVKRSQP
jgi:hypothetical protein